MLSIIKRSYYSFKLQKNFRAINVQRETVHWSDVKNIGILFDATDTEQAEAVTKFSNQLRNQKKRTQLLAFYDFPRNVLHLTFPYFNQKNLTWYGMPSGSTVKEFIDDRFDVLINAFAPGALPLEYIASFSQAKYRIGFYDEDKKIYNDFMIDTHGDLSLNSFFNLVHTYLPML
jgi:hypothetical protein